MQSDACIKSFNRHTYICKYSFVNTSLECPCNESSRFKIEICTNSCLLMQRKNYGCTLRRSSSCERCAPSDMQSSVDILIRENTQHAGLQVLCTSKPPTAPWESWSSRLFDNEQPNSPATPSEDDSPTYFMEASQLPAEAYRCPEAYTQEAFIDVESEYCSEHDADKQDLHYRLLVGGLRSGRAKTTNRPGCRKQIGQQAKLTRKPSKTRYAFQSMEASRPTMQQETSKGIDQCEFNCIAFAYAHSPSTASFCHPQGLCHATGPPNIQEKLPQHRTEEASSGQPPPLAKCDCTQMSQPPPTATAAATQSPSSLATHSSLQRSATGTTSLAAQAAAALHPPMYSIDPPPSDSDAEQSADSLAMDESDVCMLPAAEPPCRQAPTAVPSTEGRRKESAVAAAAAPLVTQSEEQREETLATECMEVADDVVSQPNVIIRYANATGVSDKSIKREVHDKLLFMPGCNVGVCCSADPVCHFPLMLAL